MVCFDIVDTIYCDSFGKLAFTTKNEQYRISNVVFEPGKLGTLRIFLFYFMWLAVWRCPKEGILKYKEKVRTSRSEG